MDYGPLLSRVFKSAFLVYMYYDKFQNDEAIVQFTYNELNQHLGLASTTIQKANKVLQKLELIEEVESATGKSYKLLPVKRLSDELRQELINMSSISDYNNETSLRKKYLDDNIPVDFQQLLNKRVLKKAHRELGPAFTRGKELCKYFKIDYHTFRLLHERDGKNSFKVRFKKLMKEIVDTAPKKKQKEKYSEEAQELTKYLYDSLATRNIKPIGNWWIKNCSIAHNLLKGGLGLQEGKEMIDWGFASEWWQDKMSDLKVLDPISTRYRLAKASHKTNKICRASPIPQDIREEISRAASISVDTYEDAYLLKQSVLSGEKEEDIIAVVGILEKRGIVPSGSENLTFG